ncbi:hypothetical protein [Mesorhizobium sp. M4B.F.Ca.ET.017.02.2.1]|uniref:hypothetical protein n=1 Tax=Mesorhizobium sp. M4B.F.Ca.ET.017.02.2.1 TaxID=2496649 RepID=UPI000FCC3AA3|nr:hypothetical protein [Mesorhizobium sp. M4B.F.Ca.ET.017.02.2.1]RVD27090.1 hypothetical protein EN738_12405 [Mesorhizobium sp. M4B.F.Ca.ET.017.02.2.1]
MTTRRPARGVGVGDEVAIHATVLRRIDEERVSVSIPTYGHPHSIADRTAGNGQNIELIGEVTRIDEQAGKVTVNLRPVVTVDLDQVKLVTGYEPPRPPVARNDKPD